MSDITQPDTPEAVPYVRTVEVVALDTFSTLLGFEHLHETLPDAVYSMYDHAYRRSPERLSLSYCRDVDVLAHPSWKVVGGDRYLVDEVSHSDKLAIRGVEFWPEFGGRFAIRGRGPLACLPATAGRFVMLGGDNNHYHWVLNFVPRLMALERLGHRADDDRLKLLVVESVPDAALELLHLLGYGPERIHRLPASHVWRIEDLVVTSFPPHNEFSPNIFAWYRQRLGVPAGKRVAGGRRIWISRGDASKVTQRRKVVNEDDVIAALRPLGFEVQVLAGLSMQEQIHLFSQAEIVVGPHGAGFANMAFSQPGSAALVLENSWNHTFMVEMLQVAGMHARSLVCDDVVYPGFEEQYSHDPALLQELRRNRDMTVEPDRLLSEITQLLG